MSLLSKRIFLITYHERVEHESLSRITVTKGIFLYMTASCCRIIPPPPCDADESTCRRESYDDSGEAEMYDEDSKMDMIDSMRREYIMKTQTCHIIRTYHKDSYFIIFLYNLTKVEQLT